MSTRCILVGAAEMELVRVFQDMAFLEAQALSRGKPYDEGCCNPVPESYSYHEDPGTYMFVCNDSWAQRASER